MTLPPTMPAPEHSTLQDIHRPLYHFTAPSGWLNDPNGIAHHGGRWHVYYQHNPRRPQWGDIHWGHASSEDLVTWRDEPMALAPTPGGADEHGCFSGSFALVNGTPTLYYTGWSGGVQTQCMATSRDLITWEKHPRNPIIPHPPRRVRSDDFRDPYVFQHAGRWYMALGASLDHDRGAVLLYGTEDGERWTYLHVLYEATRTDQGVMWECPNFFPVGDRWVLVVSVWPGLGARYFVGTFENKRFQAEREGVIDGDGGAFAHLTAQGADGRVLQWAWINEQRHQDLIDVDGWAGALSVPRELSLRNGDLCVQPARELAQLHEERLHDGEVVLQPGTPLLFDGTHLDLHLELEPDIEHPVHVTVLRAPDGSEETVLTFDPSARLLKLRRARSSLDDRTARDSQRTHIALERGEGLNLRLLLDGSVLEVYANGRACLTSRVYPTRRDTTTGMITAERDTRATLTLWTVRRGDHFSRRGP
ncbi:glycoside hydrolase family 32 protein [Deinococcus apachensis]|uniref:glycoside hydrolase family 32 protein n=1 Tax=Deinococcus apachensis TaxID=309886 RepID=UPI00037A1242|nr:glycoside hydrolase family 32 protein [Deinococcus apachensis]